VQRLNWEWIFYINLPIGAVAVLGAFVFVPEPRDTSLEQRPDLAGQAASAIGPLCISYALIGWTAYG